MSGATKNVMNKLMHKLILSFISILLILPNNVFGQSSSFNNARTRSLSGISDNYNYTHIRNSLEWLEKKDEIGVDISDKRGYHKSSNVTIIKNTLAPPNISRKRERKSAVSFLIDHGKNKNFSENLGLIKNCSNKAKATNNVSVNQSIVLGNVIGSSNVNAGVYVRSCSKQTGVGIISNDVEINRSVVGKINMPHFRRSRSDLNFQAR